MATYALIGTYNRPTLLADLLGDLATQRDQVGDLRVRVYDDCSTDDYAQPCRILREQNWNYVRVSPNHGRKNYWQLVGRMYRDLREESIDHVIQLPDDVRLCRDFFSRAMDQWNAIAHPRKIALNVLRDRGRIGKPCWTGMTPEDSGHVLYTGWVDGAFIAGPAYLKQLQWYSRPVHERFFEHAAGSGTFAYISIRLHQRGWRMYQVKQSLLAHVIGPSRMHPGRGISEEPEPLVVDFIDGDAACHALSRSQ